MFQPVKVGALNSYIDPIAKKKKSVSLISALVAALTSGKIQKLRKDTIFKTFERHLELLCSLFTGTWLLPRLGRDVPGSHNLFIRSLMKQWWKQFKSSLRTGLQSIHSLGY